MPDTQLRSARNQNRSGEPAASARIQALPSGRCTQARPRHPPLPSPDTSQELRGWRDAEGPGAPARGQQGSSTLQWWGCRGRCLEMTSGGAAPPGASAKRHAEEGPGTVSSLPRKRSQEASLLEGGRIPFLPPRLHPLSGHGNETLAPSSSGVPPGGAQPGLGAMCPPARLRLALPR